MKECVTHHHACDCREKQFADELTTLRAQLNERDEIIKEQLLSIGALNMCIGGEGSLTTDNLVRVGRLEAALAEKDREIAELKERLNEIAGDWQVKHYELASCQADNVRRRLAAEIGRVME